MSAQIEEERHLRTVVKAFALFHSDSLRQIAIAEKNFRSIPLTHQALVPQFFERCTRARAATECNARFIAQLIHPLEHLLRSKGENLFETGMYSPEGPLQQDKVKSTLTQFIRDWSKDGEEERKICYGPIREALAKHFPNKEERKSCKVLTPGAGLGRLTFDIACDGFSSQGNEFTYFMLIASNYALNCLSFENIWIIYPFVRNTLNLYSAEAQLHSISIPDINPSEALAEDSDLSMVAGDFLSVYCTQEKSWNAVACSFFLDTAHNILEYLAVISHILVPGGILISIGPLLYHYSEMPGELSIDLTWEEIRGTLGDFGFEIEEERLIHNVPYASNTHSLLKVRYDCIFFVVKKVRDSKILPMFGYDEESKSSTKDDSPKKELFNEEHN